MQRPYIHLRKVIVCSDKRLCILGLHQVFHIEERRIQSRVVAAHFVHIQVFVPRLHILAIGLAYYASLASSIIS